MKNLIILALLAPALILTGCADDEAINPTAPTAAAENDIPEAPAGMGETEFAAARAATDDIVDTAIGAGFNTLVAAVQAEPAKFTKVLLPNKVGRDDAMTRRGDRARLESRNDIRRALGAEHSPPGPGGRVRP